MSRLEQIEKMLASEPDDAFLNFALAMEYAKGGRHADALARFERVSELDPKYVPAYFQRGNLLVSMGRKDDARAAFSQGLAVAKEVGDTHAAAEIGEALNLLG